jgi:hypothetical protein
MRLLVVLLAALLIAAVPAASHPADAGRCTSSAAIPDPGDTDCDGARTDGNGPQDNCPDVRNADQTNTDGGFTATAPAAEDGSAKAMTGGDSQGDACDPDDDADGVPDAQPDNCRIHRNPDQLDADGDKRGEKPDGSALCPPVDNDGDGVIDEDDNCPSIANDQADYDQDRRGDMCDYDDDGDGVVDQHDNCPYGANVDQTDRDGDGAGTACDPNEFADAAAAQATPAPAADKVAPKVVLSTSARRAGDDLLGGMVTLATCSEACTLKATVTLGRADARRLHVTAVPAAADGALGGQGRTWLFFGWRRADVTRLARAGRRGVRATLALEATDRVGNVGRARRGIRLVPGG